MTTNTKQKIVLICIFAALFAGFAQAANSSEPIEFKFKHEVGKVQRMRVTTKTIGTMKIADPMPEQKFSQIFEEEIQRVCKKINPDGSAEYEMTIPVIAMTMDTGGIKSTLKAENGKIITNKTELPNGQKQKPMETINKLWAVMTQFKLTLTLDPKGKTVKLEGFSEAMKKAKKEMGNLSAMDQMLVDQMSKTMNDKEMMKQFKTYDEVLSPQKPVRIGDTWNSENEITLPFFNSTMRQKTEYKLIGIENFRGRSCAKIVSKTTAETVPSSASQPAATQSGGAPNPLANMKMDFRIKDGEGVSYVDYQTSEVLKTQQSMRMTIDMTMKNPTTSSAPSQPAAETHLVQNFLTSCTIELIEPKSK